MGKKGMPRKVSLSKNPHKLMKLEGLSEVCIGQKMGIWLMLMAMVLPILAEKRFYWNV